MSKQRYLHTTAVIHVINGQGSYEGALDEASGDAERAVSHNHLRLLRVRSQLTVFLYATPKSLECKVDLVADRIGS